MIDLARGFLYARSPEGQEHWRRLRAEVREHKSAHAPPAPAENRAPVYDVAAEPTPGEIADEPAPPKREERLEDYL